MAVLLARLPLLLALFVLATAGCDSADDPTPDIAGSWSGVSTLGGPGFTSSMDLVQQGRTISGTANLPNRRNVTIEGEINANERFLWNVQIGCEQWSGSLAINETADEMTGSINLDGGSCPDDRDANGTLTLSR